MRCRSGLTRLLSLSMAGTVVFLSAWFFFPSAAVCESAFFKPFSTVFQGRGYRPFKCHENVFELLQTFAGEGLNLSSVDVLFIVHRHQDQLKPISIQNALKTSKEPPSYLDRPTIPVYRLRSKAEESGEESKRLLHHVVVLINKDVLDLDYTDAPVAVPVAEYLRKMFAPEESDLEQRQHCLEQLAFYRIPAREYLDLYRRRSSYLVLDLNGLYAKLPLEKLVSPEDQALDYYAEGVEHYKASRYEKAGFFLRLAAENNVSMAQYFTGLLYLKGLGVHRDLNEAIAWFERASAQGEMSAINALAWLYATHREEKFRDGRKALEYATRACRKAPENWYSLSTLAAAFARNGQFQDAENTQQQAISLLRRAQDVSSEKKEYYLGRARTRLDLYAKRQAYEE